MADSFGLKIGLEGEKEFKKALADINQSFKVLGSEMKLATSQFDKNDKSAEALTARNKVLNKEIEAQKQKIETLRSALKNAADSFGENDRRTQNWQIQLNNAEAALNDMNRELDENEKAIKDGGKAAEESGSKFEGFGKVLKTVGVALGAVAVAAGVAAVKLGKEVIAAYADYEQLVGGVDTLFKDSSQEIQRYAANAYKTARLSANEYMEMVTGFSASLIQSLGGDTEKAAKYADMAITDMSDNANKMGTDVGKRRRREEANSVAFLTRLERSGCCKMRLAGANRAHKDQVLTLWEKRESLHVFAGQSLGQFNGIVPDEVVQRLHHAEAGSFHHAVNPVGLAFPQFQPQKVGNVLLGVLVLHTAPFSGHAAQLQRPHGLFNELRHTHHLSAVRRRQKGWDCS